MQTTDRIRRTGLMAAIALATILAGTTAASAVSARLRADADIALPSTTTASEPSLAGTVILDNLIPFTIRNAVGSVECRGTLQNRVVQSSSTGRVDFYYRFRDTSGSGRLLGFITTGFASVTLRAGYRTDGLGTKQTTRIYRHPAPGDRVVTGGMSLNCGTHEESRFILIRTGSTDFEPGGTTQIWTTTSRSTTVSTARPD